MNTLDYKNMIEKTAAVPIAGMIAGAAKKVLPMTVKGLNSFAGMSTGKRALAGAGTNAAISGLSYKPKEGESGISGRVKSMAGGALSGAMVGASISPTALKGINSKFAPNVKTYPAGTQFVNPDSTKLIGG